MSILGLDIGGANTKVVHQDGTARCVPFALWKEPERLPELLAEVLGQVPAFTSLAVTMTAELCDCFQTKRQGVGAILDAVAAVAGRRPIHVWTTEGRFISPQEARGRPLACAAANWHALATFVARLYPRGRTLLLDTGSTTTDVILLEEGQPRPRGLTDTQRLGSGELVYIGAARTPLMSLGPRVGLGGTSFPVMAELFATTRDTGILTGRLAEAPDCTDTADGRPATALWCAARVLRMIGADLEMMTIQDATDLAQGFERTARDRIRAAALTVASGTDVQCIVLAGSGHRMAAGAVRSALPDVRIERLADRCGRVAGEAACAWAVAKLKGAAQP